VALLYGRAGRLTVLFGDFRLEQSPKLTVSPLSGSLDRDATITAPGASLFLEYASDKEVQVRRSHHDCREMTASSLA
jgi:hypothetical protein